MRSVVLWTVITMVACGAPQKASPDAGVTPGGSDAGTLGGGDDAGDTTPPDAGAEFGPNSFHAQCSGAATTLTGVALAPNGTDPIQGAEISVYAAAPAPLVRGVACDLCPKLGQDNALASTRSNSDGSFTLSLDAVDKAAAFVVTVKKARFRRVVPGVAVTACGALKLTAAQTTLPGKNADGDLPKIAVASGYKDHLDQVVRAMGITEFDCIRGLSRSSTTVDTCGATTMNLGDLLANPVLMKDYAMIFISCAPPDPYEPKAVTDAAAVNLKDWAAAGGKLIVTDDSYDFVEQSFPDAIDFAGSTAVAGVAQAPNSAEIGTFSASLTGTVADASLASWLALFPGTIDASKNVALSGFLSKWAVQRAPGAKTETIVHGMAPFTPGGPADVPLTTRFEVSGCGRVIFSSYHTDPGKTSTGLLPQERILEYLMFEVGTCVRPPS